MNTFSVTLSPRVSNDIFPREPSFHTFSESSSQNPQEAQRQFSHHASNLAESSCPTNKPAGLLSKLMTAMKNHPIRTGFIGAFALVVAGIATSFFCPPAGIALIGSGVLLGVLTLGGSVLHELNNHTERFSASNHDGTGQHEYASPRTAQI